MKKIVEANDMKIVITVVSSSDFKLQRYGFGKKK